MLDISEQCGHSLAQQAALFHSIKPLFANKPLLVVANKVDVTHLESLAPADKALIDEMVSEAARMSGAHPVSRQKITLFGFSLVAVQCGIYCLVKLLQDWRAGRYGLTFSSGSQSTSTQTEGQRCIHSRGCAQRPAAIARTFPEVSYCCCAGISPEDAKLLTMSTLTEQGVMDVKQIACDRLLASRVEAKLQVGSLTLL